MKLPPGFEFLSVNATVGFCRQVNKLACGPAGAWLKQDSLEPSSITGDQGNTQRGGGGMQMEATHTAPHPTEEILQSSTDGFVNHSLFPLSCKLKLPKKEGRHFKAVFLSSPHQLCPGMRCQDPRESVGSAWEDRFLIFENSKLLRDLGCFLASQSCTCSESTQVKLCQ